MVDDVVNRLFQLMSETIMTRLLCWVVGTPTKQTFAVKVGHDDIWDNVKDAIKEKKMNDDSE